MAQLRVTKTVWSKSFPTVVSTHFSLYTCSYERGKRPCNKTFSRECDLRRHQRNHSRPVSCKKCDRRFPSQKDLQRHDNSIHNNTIKYFCPYEWCRDSIKLNLDDCIVWGFRRKDHWQKHMKDEHKTSRENIQDFQKNGIPTALWNEEKWMAILPNGTRPITFELRTGSTAISEVNALLDSNSEWGGIDESDLKRSREL